MTVNYSFHQRTSAIFVLGFNVRPESRAAALAEEKGVDLILDTVIYEIEDVIHAALEGMLKPIVKRLLHDDVRLRLFTSRQLRSIERTKRLLAGVLGDDYILADMVSLTPAPGNEAQNLHRDAGNVDFPIMVNCMVALVDFDGTNGATRCALDPPFPAAHPPSSPAPPRPWLCAATPTAPPTAPPTIALARGGGGAGASPGVWAV